MKKLWCILVVVLGLMGPSVAMAGSILSIRLVNASHAGGGSPAGLNDVSGMVRDNLGFSSCTMGGSLSLKIPTGRVTGNMGGYQIECEGRQEKLNIAVFRNGKQLLRTTVRLQDGTPFILGGFWAGQEMQMLVFLVR